MVLGNLGYMTSPRRSHFSVSHFFVSVLAGARCLTACFWFFVFTSAASADQRPDFIYVLHRDLVAKAESLMAAAHRDDPNWPVFTNQQQRNVWRKPRTR